MLPLPHSAVRAEPELMLAIAQSRIAWVIDHPHTSAWIKEALRGAAELDPVTLTNDIEMLRHLLLPLCQAQIDLAVAPGLMAQVDS